MVFLQIYDILTISVNFKEFSQKYLIIGNS